MKKIETTKETLLEDLEKFYEFDKWHFVTVNCVDLGDGFEVQYFFSRYNVYDDNICYFLKIDYKEEIPSILSIIPSAYLGEGEMVDMFGTKIKGVGRGLFLDRDSIQTPLRKSK